MSLKDYFVKRTIRRLFALEVARKLKEIEQ